MEKSSDVKIGYLCGLIDGDGTATIVRQKDKRIRCGFRLHPRLEITNTNKDMLDEVHKWLGLGVIRGYTPKNPEHSIVYKYMFSYRDMKKLLPKIIPFLIDKRHRAEILLKFLLLISSKNKRVTEDSYSKVELSLYQRIKNLNRKGRHKHYPRAKRSDEK